MTTDKDVFKRAAQGLLRELTVERGEQEQAADSQVSEDVGEAVDLLEPDGLSGDVPEAVDLLDPAGLGEDVVEMTQEKEVPEKVITTILVDGEEKQAEVLKYDDGSMRDAETGRFLAPPSPNTFEDPAKARAAVRTRYARAIEEARGGLVKGVKRKGHDVETPEQAWGVIVQEQAVNALSDERGSTGAARFVGKVTGLVTEDKQVDVQVRAAVAVVSLDAILMGMFNRLHPDDPQLALDEMRKYKAELR